VEVKAASICGTDLHIYEWDVWAQNRVKTPRIFGHEFAGEVVEVGIDPVQKILDVTERLGVDVVIEMSGHPFAIRQSFKVLRNGGRVSLLGIPSSMVELDLANDIIFKGANVGDLGSAHFRYMVSNTENP